MERRGWIKSALAALAGLPLIGRLSAASEPSLPTLADEIARLPQNAYLVEWPFKPGDGIRASLYEGIVTLHRKTGKRAEAVLVGAADAAILATDHVGFPGQTPFGVGCAWGNCRNSNGGIRVQGGVSTVSSRQSGPATEDSPGGHYG
jgi:hypothetical protein